MTIDECRLELSKAYNAWYASRTRVELAAGKRVVSPMLWQVRLTRSMVMMLETELVKLLNTTGGTAT